jgi:predicted permease
MSLLRNVAEGLRSLFRKEHLGRELDEEVRAYLEMAVDEKMSAGMSRKDAIRAVRLERGSLEITKETVGTAGWESLVETWWQDIRFGLRMLANNPGFTAVAVLTLALGIGANTTIFTIINSVLIRPLPVKNPEQLAVVAYRQGTGPLGTQFSVPDLDDVNRESATVFSGMLGYMVAFDGLSQEGKADRILTNYVTGDYFSMLGIKPHLGRFILPSEGKTSGADPILVLSYTFWKSKFGGDPAVVGRRVLINGHPSVVIGVAPAGFYGLYPFASVEGYLPFSMVTTFEAGWPQDLMTNRALQNLHVMARLKPGVSLAAASASLDVTARHLSAQYPETNKGMALSLYEERTARPDPGTATTVRKAAKLFFALIVLVMLLACANLANLLLVRSTVREREIAVRAALGATWTRLIRQMLTESTLLALLGGSTGLLLGVCASRAISSINLHSATPFYMSFGFDWRVFSFAFAVALLTGILAGLVPALRVGRAEISSALHASGRNVAGGKNRLRTALVVLQVAGSLMLLVTAGLFAKSLAVVQHTNLGFDPANIVNVTMDPSEVGYDETHGLAFYKALVERLRNQPGVQSVALTSSNPLSNYYNDDNLKVSDYENPMGRGLPLVSYSVVSPGYLETLRIPMIRGRNFTDHDTAGSQNVAIVNEAFAERFWPNQNPIGKHFAKVSGITNPAYEVVGVASNSRFSSLTGPIDAYFYLPLDQGYILSTLQVLQIRTSTPDLVLRQTQSIARELAPGLPLFNVQTLAEALDTLSGFLLFQIGAALAATLGLLGLLLALIGVYGMISYSVRQHTREIAIRLALGAPRAQILKLVLEQGIVVATAGVIFGYGAAFATSRVIADLLVGVNPTDPVTYCVVGVAVMLVALAACYMPARRAMRVNAIVALRHE